MWENVGEYALEAIIGIVIVIITRYFIPFIKGLIAKIDSEQIQALIDSAVHAAEQVIRGSKMGAERKEWVVNLLDGAGVIVDEMVDAMIEAAVKAMNDALDKASDAIKE